MSSGATLEPERCRVTGLNQNYASPVGTQYHIQIEDRGPVYDALTEGSVRRVNVIVYANYGESNARIVHGRDHDYPDERTPEQNRFIEARIKELAAHARTIIEEKEEHIVAHIKQLLRTYYLTKDEAAKREFEGMNALYPFLFSKAWRELKEERAARTAAPASLPAVPESPEAPPEDVLYPLDGELREKVIEIERVIIELGRDLQELKVRGHADDILLQTCRKLVTRAKESLSGRDSSEFSSRRLELTRNSLMTTWKQVRSRLRA